MQSFSLNDLSTDDLFSLLDCEKIEDLDEAFVEQLPIPPPKKFFKYLPNHAKSQALQVIEESSTPLDLYWVLISVFSLGVAALPVTLSVLGLTSIFGLYNFHSAYSDFIERRENNIRFFQLYDLKNYAADIIIERQKTEIANEELCEIKPRPFVSHLNPAEKPSTKQAMLRGASVSMTIMLAYYLSTAWLFEALGFMAILSVMTGPIGLTIAAGFSLAIGIFIAFQYYEARESGIYVKQQKEKLQHETVAKRDMCYQLKGIHQSQLFFKTQDNKMKPSCDEGPVRFRI